MVEVVSLIVISELMYNPASSERLPVQTEWVELYNRGEEAADLLDFEKLNKTQFYL